MKKIHIAAIGFAIFSNINAFAGNLTYSPQNPHISPGANPNNGATFDAIAALNRPKQKTSASSSELSEADQLRQSAISAIASANNAALTGNSHTSGHIDFGDGSSVDYTTNTSVTPNIRTTIFHNKDGTTTTISFPIS